VTSSTLLGSSIIRKVMIRNTTAVVTPRPAWPRLPKPNVWIMFAVLYYTHHLACWQATFHLRIAYMRS
jgi:hypothetical protein